MYTDLRNHYISNRYLVKDGFTLNCVENMAPYEKEIYIILATQEAEDKAKRIQQLEGNGM